VPVTGCKEINEKGIRGLFYENSPLIFAKESRWPYIFSSHRFPEHIAPGGFDQAAYHSAKGRIYFTHTIINTLDVIDSNSDRYLHSIPNLTGVAGA